MTTAAPEKPYTEADVLAAFDAGFDLGLDRPDVSRRDFNAKRREFLAARADAVV